MSCNGVQGSSRYGALCLRCAVRCSIIRPYRRHLVVSVWFWENVACRRPGAVSVHGVCGAWGVFNKLLADGTYGNLWNSVIVSPACSTVTQSTGRSGISMVVAVRLGVWRHICALRPVPRWSARCVSPQPNHGLDMPEFGVASYAGFVMGARAHGDIPGGVAARDDRPGPAVAPQPAGGSSRDRRG